MAAAFDARLHLIWIYVKKNMKNVSKIDTIDINVKKKSLPQV